MTLTGRVEALENQMTFVVQDLLQRIDLVASSTQSSNWDQQFETVDTSVATMKSQLQVLQSLYTNLYIRFQSTIGTLTALTGLKDYGSFYSTGKYTNPSATGTNLLMFTETDIANGISIVDGSRITVSKSGIYDMQFSAQFHKTDAGSDDADIWVSKNGTYLPWTNGRIVLEGNGAYALPSWNFILPAVSGDYFQWHWYSSDLNVELLPITGITNPIRPDSPSTVVTIVQEQ
jgi:hypothetical protein